MDDLPRDISGTDDRFNFYPSAVDMYINLSRATSAGKLSRRRETDPRDA